MQRMVVVRSADGRDVSNNFNHLTIGATITEVFAIKDFSEQRKPDRLIGIVTPNIMFHVVIDLAYYAINTFVGTKYQELYDTVLMAKKYLAGKITSPNTLYDQHMLMGYLYRERIQVSDYSSQTNRVVALVWALIDWCSTTSLLSNGRQDFHCMKSSYAACIGHYFEACGPTELNKERERVINYIVELFESNKYLFDLV